MNESPIILSLETATPGGSIFLAQGKTQLASHAGDVSVSHSNTLLHDIDACLKTAQTSLKEVELFACASGPGSFTGLRIGIATLKALAATLERPSIGIPTLRAIAHSAGPSAATVAVLPAGRGEVFAQMFSVDASDGVSNWDEATHLSPAKLVEKYGEHQNLTWAGPGAHTQREFLDHYAQQCGIDFNDERYGSGWTLASNTNNLARHIAILALESFLNGEAHSAHSLRAIYVRPSDAELNQKHVDN